MKHMTVDIINAERTRAVYYFYNNMKHMTLDILSAERMRVV
jgi:hypothetical protein